jgi:hypothetical protein
MTGTAAAGTVATAFSERENLWPKRCSDASSQIVGSSQRTAQRPS